jgi:hypothetical protein
LLARFSWKLRNGNAHGSYDWDALRRSAVRRDAPLHSVFPFRVDDYTGYDPLTGFDGF